MPDGKETAIQRRAREAKEKAETAKKARQDKKARVEIALKLRDDAAKVLAESEAALAALAAGGAGAGVVDTGVAGSVGGAGAVAAAKKARHAAEHALALATMPPFNYMQLMTSTSTAYALTGLFPGAHAATRCGAARQPGFMDRKTLSFKSWKGRR